jgi:hypothetical protein
MANQYKLVPAHRWKSLMELETRVRAGQVAATSKKEKTPPKVEIQMTQMSDEDALAPGELMKEVQ